MSTRRPSLITRVTGCFHLPGGYCAVTSHTTVPFAVPGTGSTCASPQGHVPPANFPFLGLRPKGILPHQLAKSPGSRPPISAVRSVPLSAWTRIFLPLSCSSPTLRPSAQICSISFMEVRPPPSVRISTVNSSISHMGPPQACRMARDPGVELLIAVVVRATITSAPRAASTAICVDRRHHALPNQRIHRIVRDNQQPVSRLHRSHRNLKTLHHRHDSRGR